MKTMMWMNCASCGTTGMVIDMDRPCRCGASWQDGSPLRRHGEPIMEPLFEPGDRVRVAHPIGTDEEWRDLEGIVERVTEPHGFLVVKFPVGQPVYLLPESCSFVP